jgi:hypothetical protein
MIAVAAFGVVVIAIGVAGVGLAAPTGYNPVIDPANFIRKINNPFFPLTPGTVYTYRGLTSAGEELNTVEVTRSTRVIMGVTCVEVIDTVFVNNSLEELTLDWYAQDKQGNVWYFGEDSRSFRRSASQYGRPWLAGVNGALPGIIMEANPQVGDVYRQEFLRHEAEDMAEVLSLHGVADVPYGFFEGCLVTKDYSLLNSKFVENKWYARGIGFVKETMVKGGTDIVELVSITRRGL